jgi:hypothetical protein
MQAVASKFLMTMKDFPPSQVPGDWSLDSLEKQIKGMTRCERVLSTQLQYPLVLIDGFEEIRIAMNFVQHVCRQEQPTI